MKANWLSVPLSAALVLSLAACGGTPAAAPSPSPSAGAADDAAVTQVVLSDSGIMVDGASASTDPASAVYTGAGIVYYEDGHDETYGEGGQEDAHTAEEAAAHTVVTITQPGVYRVSGTLSAGQLAVDLGEGAEEDPEAVVTLILDGADITCTVAPAVIFYRVYEYASAGSETASATVDTSAAGANVILADGSENNITGSYVAKIYQEGTDKKLHKYDGAFYSKMSMNLNGGEEGTGTLNIIADNEGLDSELHLTINGGNIAIQSQNDGINTNEDGVSVTTVNGGKLYINAGLGEEGDGIDSNGWLVINGGEIVSLANGRSGDGGLDSDLGIVLNGGYILALGSRSDPIDSTSAQASLNWSLADVQEGGSILVINDSEGKELLSYTTEKEYSSVVFSAPELTADGSYTLTVDGEEQQNMGQGGRGGPGGQPPRDLPEGAQPPDGQRPERPDGAQPGERPQRPDGAQPPEDMKGQTPPQSTGEVSPAPVEEQS